jgi:DNA-binding CsgD family transcriptional regulator
MERRDRSGHRPLLEAPAELEAVHLDAPCEELVLLSWPVRPAALVAGELTAAEAAVMALAAAGLANEEIARARGRSPRTVANQLASAYRKLGVGSRSELVARLAGVGAAERRVPQSRNGA